MGRILGKLAAAVLMLILSAPKGYAEKKSIRFFGQGCITNPHDQQQITSLSLSINKYGLIMQDTELKDEELLKPKILIKHSPQFTFPYNWNHKSPEKIETQFNNADSDLFNTRISSVHFNELSEGEMLEILESPENSIFPKNKNFELKERFEQGEDFIEVIISRFQRDINPNRRGLKIALKFIGEQSMNLASGISNALFPPLNASDHDQNQPSQIDFKTDNIRLKKVKRKVGTTYFRTFCPKSILQPLH